MSSSHAVWVSDVDGGMASRKWTVERYLREVYALERAIAANTEYLMSVSVAKWSAWLKRRALLEDFTDFGVSRFLRDLEASGSWAQKTIAGRRGDLLALWRHAADAGLVEPPHRVRAVKVPHPMPVAWTGEELGRVLLAAGKLEGYTKHGLPRWLYFWAAIKTAYESGLRRRDLWNLRITDIREGGIVVVVQHKTGRAHAAGIREDTWNALQEIHGRLSRDKWPNADKPLFWPYTPRSFYHWIDKITKAAGVRPGALQQCRRSGATHAERELPGAAMRYLGHASGSQARDWYIDGSQAYGVTLPPEAGETG